MWRRAVRAQARGRASFPSRRASAVQLSLRLLLASAVLAAPLAAQNPPASNTTPKPVAHAESLGSAKKRATSTKKAQPAKTRKATDPAAKPAKPARKTWTGGRNGYVVDSA